MSGGNHPNSLKNLTGAGQWADKDKARAAQLKGAAARKANRMAREQLKMSMAAWKELQDDMKQEEVSTIDLLKVMMYQALEEGDKDTAIDIMKNLSEYERPKLQRIESKVEEVKTDAMSDDELEARLKAALSGKT